VTKRFIGIGLLVLFASTGRSVGQPTGPATPPVPPPKDGARYFGAPQDQPFKADTIFAPPGKPPAPPPPPPPVLPTVGPDGGLFPPPPPPPPLWTGSAEAGLNGATGNSEMFNLRAGLQAQRKTARNDFTTDLLYNRTEADGLLTTNQALWNARDEFLFGNSPWSLFGALNLEYDELRAYHFRVGIYAGVGYRVIDTDATTFKLRAGAGAVREFDGPLLPDRWVPEMVFGFDFRHRFNDRSSLISILDYYPRIDDWSQYRIRARLGYEHVLDPANGLVLRIGLQDRYDSNPGIGKRNDLTYFTTLGIKF